ncbi:polyhomeotic-like protein 1 [Osmerus eperlanus]|uniref:polyhomeotic-like protein 1 n=1 Tax=Osmerus eperlanus TaxID=29151 RepID=UPI002E127307
MDAGEDQNVGSGSTNGNAQTGGNSRPPQIAHMSLYERQAVQALQALQRQPNAAQYFQQLMLQQQINSAQLHNLAAVQQATLAASRQSSSPSNSGSQATTTVNLSTTSAGGVTNPRPLGPATSATSSALSQSVLLGGNSAGQGQMYLRVNRSLRAPIASQLIFMPGGTATAAVATVTQQQQQQQQQQAQQTEAPPTSSSIQSDSDQVQNLALHCVSTPRLAAVKSEFPDRKDTVNYSQQQQQPPQMQHQFSGPNSVPSHQFSQGSAQTQVQPQQLQQMAGKMAGYAHSTANVKAGNHPNIAPAASLPPSSPTLPLSQLLLSPSGLCQARAVTTVNPAATVTHILVPTSNVATSTQGYPIGSVATKTGNTQTLVVQPLQQASVDKGPVPIQPKTAQSHRLPVQLPPRHPPPILPAPPNSQASAVGHHPPHIPVQLVGARQGSAGNTQVVALALAQAQARSACTQDSNATVTATNTTTMTKPTVGSLKRKSESDATNDMAVEPSQQDCPPMRDSAPPLSPAPTQNSALEAVAAFSSPPTLSLSLPLSRGLGGQADRPPLPQAVVKPQVLTHLIEGFVIQEGAEPFPVAGLVKERAEGPFALAGPQMGDSGGPAVMKCEYCESFAPASQFRGSKRFCSKTCAKRYNVSCSHHFRTSRGRASAGPPGPPAPSEPVVRRRGPRRSSSEIACAKIAGRHLPAKCRSESSRSEEASSCEGEEEEEEDDSPSLSPSSSLSCPRPAHCGPQSESSAPPGGLPLDEENFHPGSPAHWNVEEVCRFISSLQGCEELAAQFLSQEIDGQALLLLREEHLISTMNIKLGPALKICASIHNLRD